MLQRSRANTFFFHIYRSYAKITTGEKVNEVYIEVCIEI